VEVLGLGRLAHGGELVGERGQLLLRHPDRGLSPCDLLQGRAYRVDLAELLGGDLTDPGAAVGPGLHQAHRLQLAQRLTDGSLAGPELDRDLALDDALAGTVGAVEDALDEAILDLVA
jgi:hypothetical protein